MKHPNRNDQNAGGKDHFGQSGRGRAEWGSENHVKQLVRKIKRVPPVRFARVQELRQAIAKGTYYVETRQLAKKLVDTVLLEALLSKRSFPSAL